MDLRIVDKLIISTRHTEAESNLGIYGDGKSPLTRKGRADARKRVAPRICKFPIDTIVTSTYIRALELAQIVAHMTGLPMIESDLFIERRRPQELYGKHQDLGRPVMDGILQGYLGDGSYKHSDEETLIELKVRVNAIMNFLEELPGEVIYVSTHAFVLKLMQCWTLFGPDFTGKQLVPILLHSRIDNGGICVFEHGPHPYSTDTRSRWVLTSWNDVSHLR